MNKVVVTNKKELKEAINNNAQVISVTGDFAKKLKPIAEFMNADSKKKAKIIAFVGSAAFIAIIGVNVAGLALAPETGGASVGVAGLVDAAAGSTLAVSAGLTGAQITALAVIAVLIGSTTLVELLKNYSVFETKFKVGKDGIEFTRNSKK